MKPELEEGLPLGAGTCMYLEQDMTCMLYQAEEAGCAGNVNNAQHS